jgi:ABC-type dipeptide/oligopeptide/nickel transport system permease component
MSGSYVLKRLLWALPTLFGVATVVFVLLRVVPGDPIAMMTPPGARAEDIARLRHVYGLDTSIAQQFVTWLGQVARGDFGNSISLRQHVVTLVVGKLPATLELVLFAMLIACSLGVGLALTAVYFRERWPELAIDGFAGLSLAIPDFLWALLLVLLLGAMLPVLPISGRLDPGIAFEPRTDFYLLESLISGKFTTAGTLVQHLLLPGAALALPLAASITRVLKSSLLEVMNQDYVTLARVKGYSRARVLLRVALRNALIPAVTLTGVQFTFLVGGTVLIEYIFAYPGIGNLAIGAVIQRDLPLIQGLILTFAVLFIITNLIVDMTYALLNPKLRQA